MARFVTVTCPECRATEAEPLDEGHYRCRHCRSTFLRESAPRPSPPPPAAATGSKVGAIGVAAALLLGVIGGAALVGRSRREGQPPRVTAPPPRVTAPPRTVLPPRSRTLRAQEAPPEKPPRVELKEVRAGRTRIGGMFWLVRYANVGEVAVERPAVVVSLFDDAGRRVEEQSGWAPIHRLAPGEEAPVLVLVSRPPPHARAEIAARQPQAERGWRRQLRLQVKEHSVVAQTPAALVGTVRNATEEAARFVQIIVVGRDERGAMASYATGMTTRPGLPPATESGFKVYLGTFQIAPPVRYEVTAVGSL